MERCQVRIWRSVALRLDLHDDRTPANSTPV